MIPPTDVAPAADPLAALRAATASRHEALDGGLPIGSPDASLPDYTAHLARLRAWLTPLHAWLAGFADGPPFDHAVRLALIDADLAEAGASVLTGVATGSQAWPATASAAYRWGVHYVIEGSQLGGAVLYERLRGRLAPHRLRYLKGNAAGPGPRWRAFTQALRAHVRTPAEIADACAGACAAFDSILELRPELSPELRPELRLDSRTDPGIDPRTDPHAPLPAEPCTGSHAGPCPEASAEAPEPRSQAPASLPAPPPALRPPRSKAA